ncbi:MAG: amino acid ABC transporter permease [Cyanobacteria bacterium J06641_5]
MRASQARDWVRKNLFGSTLDSSITIALGLGLLWAIARIWIWAAAQAQWAVIEANWRLLIVGRYPDAQVWRLQLTATIFLALLGTFWGAARWWRWPLGLLLLGGPAALAAREAGPGIVWPIAIGFGIILGGCEIGRRLQGRIIAGAWLAAFPLLMWLTAGGLGLQAVATNQLTGLVLTLLAAIASIVLSFPLGLLLALGRRSDLPVVRWLCAGYIEIVRGLPLIGILFFAQVMLPLFLPERTNIDRVVRAIAGLALFSAAYLAENVRGGLQAVPRGQVEAACALGFKAPQIAGLIVLPQALRVALPPITNQFIGLLKNTALLSVVGLVELVGIARSVLANPNYLGRYAEVYIFIGIVYWLICYCMSIISQHLERKFATDRRA